MKTSVPRSDLVFRLAAWMYVVRRGGPVLLFLAGAGLAAFMIITQIVLSHR